MSKYLRAAAFYRLYKIFFVSPNFLLLDHFPLDKFEGKIAGDERRKSIVITPNRTSLAYNLNNKVLHVYVPFFSRSYLSLDEETAELIWHPKITFKNVLSVEKIQGFGYEQKQEYYIIYPNIMEMDENLKVTFSCDFAFQKFPFDRQECNFSLYESIYIKDYVQMETAKLYYNNQHVTIDSNHSLSINSPKIPFRIDAVINPVAVDYSRNSISSIQMTLQRISQGQIIGGFFVPTGIFAILSMASYLINPDVVRPNIFLNNNKVPKYIIKSS